MNLSAESQRELERLMGLVTVYLLRHGQANRVELESALSALLEKLARTEAEVDRLDGIRGELETALTAQKIETQRREREAMASAVEAVEWHQRCDEARRLAERMRDERTKGGWPVRVALPAEREVLPWELGSPAAGREEGK